MQIQNSKRRFHGFSSWDSEDEPPSGDGPAVRGCGEATRNVRKKARMVLPTGLEPVFQP